MVVYGILEMCIYYSSFKIVVRLFMYFERFCILYYSVVIVIKYFGMVCDVLLFLLFINIIIYFLCIDFFYIVGFWFILIGIMWLEG